MKILDQIIKNPSLGNKNPTLGNKFKNKKQVISIRIHK